MVSEYGEGIINRLHPDSVLRQEGNPARTLIMKTIGAWLDDYDVTSLYDNSFLSTATGRWLDLYGRDLSVPRKLDESDEDYRTRLIYASVGNLSIDYLLNVFGLTLYSFREDFNVRDNTLVSDNPFLNTGGYISVADSDVISVLDRKLLLDDSISWVNDEGSIDYVLNTQGLNILSDYSKIYTLSNINKYFIYNTSIQNVKLNLPNATDCNTIFNSCSNLVNVDLNLPNASDCYRMFLYCSSLQDIDLNLPSATDCGNMFMYCSSLVNVDLSLPNASDCELMFMKCSSLVNVKLNLPKLSKYTHIFIYASNIETIDVTIPNSIVSGFKSYVLGLNLANLTSFKINGEEQL